MTSIQSRVDIVKSAVSSTSTCTSSTVTLLSGLLNGDPSPTKQPSSSIRSSSRKPLKPTTIAQNQTKRTVKTSARSTKPKSSEAGDHIATQLSQNEKAILATEVINSTLKALGSAVHKTPAINQTQPKKTHARQALRRSSSVPGISVGTRTLERIASSPLVPTLSRKSSTLTTINSVGAQCVAECARLAFACLRTLQASKSPSLALPALRLENGMSTLIAKLTALGLDDLAGKELMILKGRLDVLCGIATTYCSNGLPVRPAPLLADVLELRDIPPAGPITILVITTQVQALRLISTSKRPLVMQSALSRLESSSPSSIIHLMLAAARSGGSTVDWCTKQLELVASLLLSMTPSVSASEDQSSINSKLVVSPDIALRLQCLALEIRVQSWSLTDRVAEIERDILDPLSRSLSAFARRHLGEPTDTYHAAGKAFSRFEKFVEVADSSRSPGLVSIYKTMGSLGQQALLYDEAVHWFCMVNSILLKSGASEVKRCSIAARLLALRLQAHAPTEHVETLVKGVLNTLQGPLQGSSQELDDLFIDVSTARKIAIAMISDKSGEQAFLTQKCSEMCEIFIFSCPRFVSRYLGTSPGPGSTPKAIIAYEQRQKLVSRVLAATIDSSLYLLQKNRTKPMLTWDVLDSTLQLCLSLSQTIGDQISPSAAGVKSHAVKISHLYYLQHLDYQREEEEKDTLKIRALRRSIDAVESSPAKDKVAANRTSKLERLSGIYASLGRIEDARAAISILRDDLISAGVLSTLTHCAAHKALNAIWTNDGDALTLSRTIGALVKFEVKIGSRSIDNVLGPVANCDAEQKGLFLEQVLEVLAAQTKDVSKILADVATEILSIYGLKQFPMRRLRVLIQLFRCGSDGRDLKEELRNTIVTSRVDSWLTESQDIALAGFLSHLQALASSFLELREAHPRTELVRQHLQIWSTILADCSTHSSISSRIDDIDKLIDHLQSVAEYLDLIGAESTRVAVLRMMAEFNEVDPTGATPDDLLSVYTALGLQYLRLGYSGKAGVALDKAQSHSKRPGASYQAQIRYSLAHAEYLLSIGNLERGESILSETHELVLQWTATDDSSLKGQNKHAFMGLLADAALVHSMLAMRRGALTPALTYAKQSTKLLYNLWDQIERQTRPCTTARSSSVKLSDRSNHDRIDNVSTKDVSDEMSVASLPKPALWALLPGLVRSLLWLSNVYTHHGLYPDALFYAEQAKTIGGVVGPGSMLGSVHAVLGDVWHMARIVVKSRDAFIEAKELCSSNAASMVSARTHIGTAKLYTTLGNKQEHSKSVAEAEAVIQELMNVKTIRSLDRVLDPAVALEAEMTKLTIVPRKQATARKKIVRVKPVATKPQLKVRAPTEEVTPIEEECGPLVSMKGSIIRHKAYALSVWKDVNEVAGLLETSSKFCFSSMDHLDQLVVTASHLMAQGIAQMAADPVFSMLQDSTISYPSIVLSGTLKDHAPKQSPVKRSKTAARSKSPSSIGFCDKLHQAQDRLNEAYALASRLSCATRVSQKICAMLSATCLLLSAAGTAKTRLIGSTGHTAYSIEMIRNNAIVREKNAQVKMVDTRVDGLEWPSLADITPEISDTSNSLAQDAARFQKEYVDILPSTWSVLSISLTDDRQGLCISKMQAGQCPFVIRLPLGRNNSRDADEEVFDFEEGRKELCDIITQANESAHGARKISGKGDKSSWWAQRDALDLRLKELLDNIEKVWLGGFKGIFSEHTRSTNLLARFQRSFQIILDKHLPSRQKTGRKAKATQKVTLDARILDLFIGLGDPSAPDADFDEPLTDLLYFVVDILQFHGERNAYDEIDFDSMVIESIDALRSYYEALKSDGTSDEERHTILVLDKALHAFPWESLPCMQKLAVSRMPSVSCIRDRILAQEESTAPDSPEGHFISRSSGSYILNPSGDLKHTESTFTDLLSSLSLPSTRTITNRIPTEAEFQTLLTESSYLLYFGHGSGVQYIRPKTLRRLEKPAVALLMGCSSGALTECGEFEPYGTAMDYIIAGSPAIVANLWDVTDRDCDRFAIGALENWGLFSSEESVTKAKGKGKEKVTEKKHVSLVRAVAEAKSRCNYRYLTAAAVCVYGIPVYLK